MAPIQAIQKNLYLSGQKYYEVYFTRYNAIKLKKIFMIWWSSLFIYLKESNYIPTYLIIYIN